MNLLHISADYPFSDLYRQMLIALDAAGVESQTMYVPIKRRGLSPPTPPSDVGSARVVFSADFDMIDRFSYSAKRRKTAAAVPRNVDLKQIDGVHAHFLFSGGGVAQLLERRDSVPYVVAVRNTDVNLFFKRMVHLRSVGLRIMLEARAVVFLSPSYLASVIERYVPQHLRREILSKSVVVPNGIDPYWFQHQPVGPKQLGQNRPVRLLFVGELSPNKNVGSAMRAVLELQQQGLPAHLKIVGDGRQGTLVNRLSARYPSLIERVPRTSSRDELLAHYRSSDILVMASRYETFGLVYAEAMSQGLPVIYSKDQGIDGYFDDGHVGYSVVPGSSESIASAVQRIIANGYENLSQRAQEGSLHFEWDTVAQQLTTLYERSFLS